MTRFGFDDRGERGHGGRSGHGRHARAFASALHAAGRGYGSRERFGRDGGREGFGGPRGGGRRGRLFDGAELRLVLLSLIADEPRHGYDLIRAIEERSGGAYAPSPGVVYPTLTLLVDMDHIAEAPRDGNRKTFAVTDAGRALVAGKADEIAALFARLDALAGDTARTDGGPIRRALMNLRHAVHATARDGDVAHDIAAILDEAAQRIERL